MRKGQVALALAVAGLAGTVPAGCATVEAVVHVPGPAVEISDGADKDAPKSLTLSPDAVRRLELQTVVVTDPASIPYSAIIYDKKGAPWVYSSPEELAFVRLPVTIAGVEGDTALLTTGPLAGTRIVTRAAISSTAPRPASAAGTERAGP